MTAKHAHNHATCLRDAMTRAAAHCEKRGARLTEVRKRVLELVWQSHEAAKTYDILAILTQENASAKPPTVYRALEFLQTHGLVHKNESLRGYVGCAHPEAQHICQFLICDECERVQEFCNEVIANAVNASAATQGFTPRKQMLEVHGVCAECTG